jgi:AraC-like DNA-binding protein
VPGWSSEKLRALVDQYSWEAMERESPPRVKELAASLRISSAECTSLFRHVVGDAPSSYLRRLQLERAKRLLLQTTLSMNEIAYQSGFGTRTTFFRAFKRQTGLTPKQYRLRNG